jgi:hypothetical protein
VLLTSRCVIGGNPQNAVTRMWLDAEAAVRDSGVGWTILRPSGFQSNALRWLPQLREGDVVRAPWPAVPIAAIDPADIAAVASVVLTGPGHEGAALTLSGPEPLTPGEQVAALGRALRRPLRYEPLSDDEARASMADDGTPASLIDAFFRFFSAGEFDDSAVTTTVHEITGRPPRTFDHWAHAHANLFGDAGLHAVKLPARNNPSRSLLSRLADGAVTLREETVGMSHRPDGGVNTAQVPVWHRMTCGWPRDGGIWATWHGRYLREFFVVLACRDSLGPFYQDVIAVDPLEPGCRRGQPGGRGAGTAMTVPVTDAIPDWTERVAAVRYRR